LFGSLNNLSDLVVDRIVTEIANGVCLQLPENAKEDKVQSVKNIDRMGKESHFQDAVLTQQSQSALKNMI
jgi:hypothetical protein